MVFGSAISGSDQIQSFANVLDVNLSISASESTIGRSDERSSGKSSGTTCRLWGLKTLWALFDEVYVSGEYGGVGIANFFHISSLFCSVGA